MDRLLTDEERPNLPPNSVSIYAPTLLDKIKDLEYKIAKAQDAKTAHLVAQEIRQQIHYSHQAFTDKYDYEGLDPRGYKFVSGLFSQFEQAIKSKWVKE